MYITEGIDEGLTVPLPVQPSHGEKWVVMQAGVCAALYLPVSGYGGKYCMYMYGSRRGSLV